MEGGIIAGVTELTFDQIKQRYLAAIEAGAGLPAGGLGRVETLVLAEADREDSAMAVAYHVGCPTLIRTDPALAEELSELASPVMAINAKGFEAWSANRGWTLIDGGDQHIASRDQLRLSPLPPTARMVVLDRDVPSDRSLMAALFDASDPDDVDSAELDIDDLDPHIIGLLDPTHKLGALVSGRPWHDDDGFDDIGVLTHDQYRGQGWGAAAVSTFCVASFDRGRIPLYRCNWSRVASKALAMSLGFQLIGHVTAVGPST